ncbi:hypothetical protein Dda_7099 [Drechslerella dactyloides]|uniref:Uncharacterized protein n=1 Tax=Drechslerella dactyloides TaxID=74499 RepID=A0AAD6IV49_DREDA|nr:hypothetical protein Dda_7099 [Drechslerella dactyloides]
MATIGGVIAVTLLVGVCAVQPGPEATRTGLKTGFRVETEPKMATNDDKPPMSYRRLPIQMYL